VEAEEPHSHGDLKDADVQPSVQAEEGPAEQQQQGEEQGQEEEESYGDDEYSDAEASPVKAAQQELPAPCMCLCERGSMCDVCAKS
jgi:hypothetical protein